MTKENIRPHVTGGQTVNGWHVALIVNGVAITLPAFLIGAEIMAALGTRHGVLAIFAGGIILSIIASVCMSVAVSTRMTTYQMLEASFGSLGSRLVSFLVSLILLGWFGVTASLFGQAVAKSVEELFAFYLSIEVYVFIGCGMMVLITVFGFRAIDLLSKFTVPLMLAVLISGAYFTSSNFTLQQIWAAPPRSDGAILSFGSAVSMVVGSFMVGITILPDIARFINRKKQVYVASLGSYGSVFAVVLVTAGLPGLMTGETDLVAGMYQSGLGVPALLMMIFASLTTNISNLYSCSLGFAQVVPTVARWQITLLAGIAGGVLALSNIIENLITYLVFLSVLIPPVAGIYMAHSFVNFPDSKGNVSAAAVAAWGLASGVSYAATSDLLVLTTIPALDSLLLAVGFYAVFKKACAYALHLRP